VVRGSDGSDEDTAHCYQCGALATTAAGVPTCPRCGPLWKLVRNALGAEVLIVDGDRVLLVRRAQEPWRGQWELPGGFVELGEHPAVAARREVAEELGAVVRLTGLLGFYLDPHVDDVVSVVTFVGELDGDLEVDAAEVAEVGWFAPDALPGAGDLAANHSERLRDWLRSRRGEVPIGLGFDGPEPLGGAPG
jgi:8-oxo-dGTP diphosphatase